MKGTALSKSTPQAGSTPERPVLAEGSSLNTFETSAGVFSRAWRWIRTRHLAGASTRRLQVAETVSLGEKRFVAVVRVDGRHFLLAGGPANIALLAQLNETEPFEDVLKKTMTVPEKQPAKRGREKKKTPLEKELKPAVEPAVPDSSEAFAGVLKRTMTGPEKQRVKRGRKRSAFSAGPANSSPAARPAKHSTKRAALPGDRVDVSPLETQRAAKTSDQWLEETDTVADKQSAKPATKPAALEGEFADIPRYAPSIGTPTLDNWLLETMSSPEKQIANSTVEEFA